MSNDPFSQVFQSKGLFPRTKRILQDLSKWIKAEWESRLSKASPSWWGRMALSKRAGGGGGILMRRIAGGFEVFYANKGKYDYMGILDRGRGPYDMKPALINGPRSRAGKNGRYTIIGFSKNEDGSTVGVNNNSINSVITKIGSYRDEEGKNRNAYSYNKEEGMTGKGNVFLSQQVNKDGSVSRSGVKFITVSARSKGFIYPAIPAHNIMSDLKQEVQSAIARPAVKRAISADCTDIARGIIRKYKNR